MKINIISDTDRRIPRKKIIRMVELIEEDEEPPESTVNIIFTRNNQIARLNKQYRNMSGPTDVLSFNIDDEFGPESTFGEIYISTDMAVKNLKEFGGTFSSELIRLCCHGFLHLLGYDHKNEKDRKIMLSKENKYLEQLN